MNNRFLLISGLAMFLSVTTASIQAQTAQANELQAGATVRVTLQKPLDARKNKPGDPVIVKTAENVKSDGRVIVPKGSKVVGHVTTVKAHSKESPDAALGIVFDRAVLKDGREIPLHVFVQAVAPGQEATIPTMSMTPATAAGTGGGMGPVTGPLTSGPSDTPNTGTPARVGSPESPIAAAEDSMSSQGDLTPTCRGVLRMDGLALVPKHPTFGSVIVSRNRNIQLDIGTQMMLRAADE